MKRYDKKMRIFDAHMHVGRAYKATKSGSLEEYDFYGNNVGISDAIVIPPCVPNYQTLSSGERYMPFFYNRSEGVQVYVYKNGTRYEKIKKDPFAKVNRTIFENINSCTYNVNFHFAPE